MNVNLTPELEALVQRKVKSGRYNSASEVVREALRLLEQRDEVRQLQMQALRKTVDEGQSAFERGETSDGGAFFAALEREARAPSGKRKQR